MILNFKTIISFFLFISLSSFSWADNSELIKEMEIILKTLKNGDQTKLELTKRLADLYFKDAVQLRKDLVLKGEAEDSAALKELEGRSLSLYSEALKGGLSSAERSLIMFQQARLQETLGQKKKATQLYKSILSKKELPKAIEREAALKLAEQLDDAYKDKAAMKYYRKSLALCQSKSLCAYIAYRLAWVEYRTGMIEPAVATMRSGLWGDAETIQEKSLSDFIVFMSHRDTDGKAEYLEIQELAKKLQRPKIIRELGETFFTAGNRKAGVFVLSEINAKEPSIYYTARLTEELYGFREWDKFRNNLNQLGTYSVKDLPQDESKSKEIKEIITRLTLQLDGEAKSNIGSKPQLQQTIDIFLTFYPNDKLRKKMVDGWLNVEKDNSKKIKKLNSFISHVEANGPLKEELRLRQMRISLAQKEKLNELILSESEVLAVKLESEVERRKFRYLHAHTLYKLKRNDDALSIFQEMARLDMDKSPDKWAIQSQHLALDILNQKKDYKGILAQSSTWTNRAALKKDKKLAKELKQMDKISLQARFEQAFTLGESPEALAVFESFCYQGQFEKKACPNVKVLAIKLQKQDSIIRILEYNKDEKSLMGEYERVGQFSKAAKLQEKFNLNKKSGSEDYLRIALLYELDGNIKDQKRILSKMMTKIRKKKEMTEKLEPLIYQTLTEAGYFGKQLLDLPWKLSRKMRIVAELEGRGIGNKKSRRLLLNAKNNMGAQWESHRVKPLIPLYKKQAKMKFYGRYMKSRFKKRVAALTKFATESKKVLEISSPKARVYIGQLLVNAYRDLSDQIENMPISKYIEDQAQRDQIKQNLLSMAAPFRAETKGYQDMVNTQLLEITEDKVKLLVTPENLKLGVSDYFALFKQKEYRSYKKNITSLNLKEVEKELTQLSIKPDDSNALSSLESFFTKNDHQRLAAYYKGRLLSTKEGGNL